MGGRFRLRVLAAVRPDCRSFGQRPARSHAEPAAVEDSHSQGQRDAHQGRGPVGAYRCSRRPMTWSARRGPAAQLGLGRGRARLLAGVRAAPPGGAHLDPQPLAACASRNSIRTTLTHVQASDRRGHGDRQPARRRGAGQWPTGRGSFRWRSQCGWAKGRSRSRCALRATRRAPVTPRSAAVSVCTVTVALEKAEPKSCCSRRRTSRREAGSDGSTKAEPGAEDIAPRPRDGRRHDAHAILGAARRRRGSRPSARSPALAVGGYGLQTQRTKGEQFDNFTGGSTTKICGASRPDKGGPACKTLYDQAQTGKRLDDWWLRGSAARWPWPAIVGFVASSVGRGRSRLPRGATSTGRPCASIGRCASEPVAT